MIPYHPSIQDILICITCATFDDPETNFSAILEFPQEMWMAPYMDHSRINLNQCHGHGIMLCGAPFEMHNEDLGIHDPTPNLQKDQPFYYTKNYPLTKKIGMCKHSIIMSSDQELDLVCGSFIEYFYLLILTAVEYLITVSGINDYILVSSLIQILLEDFIQVYFLNVFHLHGAILGFIFGDYY